MIDSQDLQLKYICGSSGPHGLQCFRGHWMIKRYKIFLCPGNLHTNILTPGLNVGTNDLKYATGVCSILNKSFFLFRVKYYLNLYCAFMGIASFYCISWVMILNLYLTIKYVIYCNVTHPAKQVQYALMVLPVSLFISTQVSCGTLFILWDGIHLLFKKQ